MSYNILSGNVNFADSQDSGQQGTIEDLVDTHTSQLVSGSKDVQMLTGSTINLRSNIQHEANETSKFGFTADNVYAATLNSAQMLGLYGNLSPKKVQIDNSDFRVNTSGLDFFISSSNGRVGIGMLGNYAHALEVS